MKVLKNHNRKAFKSILIIVSLSMALLATGFGIAQGTSTLTPVQTETNLSAQPTHTTGEVTDINPQGSTVVTTVVTTTSTTSANTTPAGTTSDSEVKTDNPESRVCDALASQIISNLAKYDNWEISLNDSNGNVQGQGTMTPSGLELELFNPDAKELYLYYFTNEKAITIANSSGLRISLIQRDSTQSAADASSTYTTDAEGRGIIINATIGEDREALPINDCILPFEQVFPNYSINGN